MPDRNNNTQTIISRQLAISLTALSLFLGIFVGFIFAYAYFNSTNDNQTNNSSLDSGISEYINEEYLANIINIFNEKYINNVEDLSKEDVTYGLVKGFVSSFDDKYTNFLDPEEASEYLSQSTGDFQGIGVTLAYDGQNTYVETLLKGNPAEIEGILPGDVILKVDDKDVAEMLPSQVAVLIRGEKGTNVKLDILRVKDSVPETLQFQIERNLIDIDNITWEKLEDGTIKINIAQFNDETLESFNKTWDKVVNEILDIEENPENIVVDLRGNPGGYVYSVRYVLEDFLSDGKIIMKERSNRGEIKEYKDRRKGSFEESNLYVLVNEGSASASEIFASAIQDNERGTIIGKPTVGKGVEQELIKLEDGSLLLLVFQEWLTPNEKRINEDSPIIPDFEVEYTVEDYKKNDDKQLNKALELVKEN